MKRRKMFLLPALALLAACSSDEPVNIEEGGNRVAFKTFVSPQGRGTEAAHDVNFNLQQGFGVFVYSNADGVADGTTAPGTLYNEEVRFTPGTGFGYTNTIYWPVTSKLAFYAYSPYEGNPATATSGVTAFVPANATTPGEPGFTFRVDDDTNAQTDLLVAKAERLSAGTVPLPFRHALSKVEVQARTSALNYRVAIMAVKLSGIYSEGDYRFMNAATPWINQRSPITYTGVTAITGNSKPNNTGVPAAVVLYNANANSYTAVTNPANAMYLMPQTLNSNAKLTITYNIFNAQSGNLISSLESQDLVIDLAGANTASSLAQWEKSRRILYRLLFAASATGAGSEVKFEATLADWSVENDDLF